MIKYLALLLIFVVGCANMEDESFRVVSLKTEDNVRIVADYYENNGTSIILLHMLSRNRNDWKDFALELQKLGYNVLALDLRGHGDSDLNYQDFKEKDFNNMLLDIKAAKEFLKTKKVIVIGASIGANLAIIYPSTDKDVIGAIALSPSFNYRGLKTEDEIKKYNNALLLVSSEEDKQSISDSKKLYELSPSNNKELKIYENVGHGTRMFTNSDLKAFIIEWLKKAT